MTTAATSAYPDTTFVFDGSFDAWFRKQLAAAFEGITDDDLPPALLAALAPLAPQATWTPLPQVSATSQRGGWLAKVVSMMPAMPVSRRTGPAELEARMFERAIRKQGMSWLADCDPHSGLGKPGGSDKDG